MMSRRLPLGANNFAEWLASLGLLQLVAAVSEDPPKLSYDADGTAHLHSNAGDDELKQLLLASTNLHNIHVRYYAGARRQTAPAKNVSIGQDLYVEQFFALDAPPKLKAFETSAETKDGCSVGFALGRGLGVRHFHGKALCDLAGLRSPVKTWSGQITFPRIFLSVRDKVAGTAAGAFDELLTKSSRETQRFRYDHAWEDYFDDGCVSLEEGAQMRPAVEWLAFLGLSFFPPEWGWKSFSPQRNRLRSYVWRNPLDVTALTLALHSGQLTPAADFQIVVGGKFEPKKIRFLSACT